MPKKELWLCYIAIWKSNVAKLISLITKQTINIKNVKNE